MRKSLCILLSAALALGAGCHAHDPVKTGADSRLQRVQDQENHQQSYVQGKYNASPASDDNNDAFALVAVMFSAIASPFVALGDAASGNTPAKAVRKMEDMNSADIRRQGIADLVTKWDFAKKPPYTTRYRQIAQNDPDFTVRAMAIRALNISRDASATQIFIAGLDDENELIRLESAKALANIPDVMAIPGLIRRVQGKREITSEGRPETVDESKDVRIAAADALRHYPTLDVARTLVSVLGERDFGLAWQSRRSLISLTGQDLNYDEAAWLRFLSGTEKPFG